MKIYISSDYSKTESEYMETQEFLENIGFDVVCSFTDAETQEQPVEQRIVNGIRHMLTCDAVFMLSNWFNSLEASIEYDVAIRMGKDFLYEKSVQDIRDNQKTVNRVQSSILEVMGMKLSDYSTKSRNIIGFYARMIFVYQCRSKGMTSAHIAKYLNRDRCSIIYCYKAYINEVVYNPKFKRIAQQVDEILNPKTI